ERGEVRLEVRQQARVDPRGAEELRLAAAADADAVPGVGLAAQELEGPQELARGLDGEEVDAGLEAVGGAERLGEDEVPRREVQADPVLEARVGLVVQV